MMIVGVLCNAARVLKKMSVIVMSLGDSGACIVYYYVCVCDFNGLV